MTVPLQRNAIFLDFIITDIGEFCWFIVAFPMLLYLFPSFLLQNGPQIICFLFYWDKMVLWSAVTYYYLVHLNILVSVPLFLCASSGDLFETHVCPEFYLISCPVFGGVGSPSIEWSSVASLNRIPIQSIIKLTLRWQEGCFWAPAMCHTVQSLSPGPHRLFGVTVYILKMKKSTTRCQIISLGIQKGKSSY